MKKVAFYTLGCKLNFAESSGLSQQFVEKGYEIVDFKEQADIYVINTCTVTAMAEKKCRQSIQAAIARNAKAKIAVIGCFSQLRSEEISKIQGVDYILGNADKHLLIELFEKNEIQNLSMPEVGLQKEFYPFYSVGGRTRSFFKIQDGCDNFCTYCAIPFARGRSRSNTLAQTLSKAKEIAHTGAKEVILTGVNIGDFGRKNGETFYDLIQALDVIEGIERFRISSIEPDLLTDEIIQFVSLSQKFMPHFHIPLQAGNNEVLANMKRHYQRELFAERVYKIKEVMPQAFIAADVIVGFPSESEVQFEDAYLFMESLPLSALHVFTYSSRPGTL
ncbi:MAG: tRNA (N(6)-L-threonylcarbamoyladenosine(37)-C(2))-methylthiotransferase MtaB, partial [Bacteroidales bacterium]